MSFRRFLRRAFGVTALLMLVNVLYYVYQFILNHTLDQAVYGVMGQLISLTLIAAVPSVAVSLFITRYITLYEGRGLYDQSEYIVATLFQKGVRFVIFITLLLLIITPIVAPRLGISGGLYVLLVLTVSFSMLMNFIRAVMYAREKLSQYAINLIFETAFRVIVTSVVFLWTRDLMITYGIFFLSIFFSVGLFFREIRSWSLYTPNRQRGGLHDDTLEMKSQILPMAMIAIFVALVGNVEILLFGQLQGVRAAAMMTAMMLIGKLIIVVFSTITSIGFPYFSQSRQHQEFLRWLYMGTILATLIGILILYFFGGQMVQILLAPAYHGLAPYIFPFGLSMILVGWILLLIQHFSLMGYRQVGYLSPLVYVSLIIAVTLAPHTFEGSIYAMLYGYSVGFIFIIFGLIFFIKKEQ